MQNFRLLSRTRQATEYSCGACALQAVLSYWGKEVEEEELMRLMGTNDAVGTYPENMVRGIQALGFEAEARENLTLDEVKRVTDQGHPVIGLAQVWRSAKASPGSPLDEWDSGHYIVILGVDAEHVYFQDPYVRMAKAFMPRQVFEDHWHQIMGGKASGARPIQHCAVFVRGKSAPAAAAAETPALPAIAFETLGSVNLVTIHFAGQLLPYDFMAEIKETLPRDMVRADAFVMLRKDRQGRLSAVEGGLVEDEQELLQINALVGAIAGQGLTAPGPARSKAEAALKAAAAGDFGLSSADLKTLGERVAPGESMIVILFQNLWERRLKEIAGRHGGTVVSQRLLASDALAEFGRRMTEAAAS
jgi:predicted double-glycine peptidase